MNPNYAGKTEAELEALKTDRVRAIRAIEDDIDDIQEALEALVTGRKVEDQVARANAILSPEAREALIAGATAEASMAAKKGAR